VTNPNKGERKESSTTTDSKTYLDDIVKNEAMRVCALHFQNDSLEMPHLNL